ncbi:hypothetical protein TBR22_A18470 [Luteitalea sp. TBR-22]|nr:hypothetical protein TBR22_A18470 [Luteitalea sp. TBR-22]
MPISFRRRFGVPRHAARCLVAACLALGPSAPARAQGGSGGQPATRAAQFRDEREAKRQATHAYEPNALERGMRVAETRGIFAVAREGFYPKLGSLAVGSGFSFGVGFRDRDLLRHTGAADVFGAMSTVGYVAAEGRVRFPSLLEGRLDVEGWAGRREYVREYYFGLGPGSARGDQADYAVRNTMAGGRAGVTLVPGLVAGGGLEYLTPRLGEGNDDGRPGVDQIFTPETAPGLDARADFLRTSAFAELDTRRPRYARSGGLYRLEFSRFDDRTGGSYGFDRTEVDLRHFVGFLGGRRVIGLRGFVSTSDPRGGGTIPFFLMPALGGNDSLRGFRNQRFRGPHALLLQAEYRWEIWSGLDGALFYDAGKTPLERRDLDLHGLQSDYGFGFRVNTNNGVIFRVDAAFGSRDGRHLYLVWGGVF